MIKKNLGQYLAGKKFIRKILDDPVDLSEFKQRPTPRLIGGLVLMSLSYVIGWPIIFVLSILAVSFREPLIFVIGGPLAYAVSCVVFLIGAWMARAPHYMNTLTRYALQSLLKKLFDPVRTD